MNQSHTPAASGAAAPVRLDPAQHLEDSITAVREALGGLRYGSVLLTVHEGRVVQIDVTEKRRLRPA